MFGLFLSGPWSKLPPLLTWGTLTLALGLMIKLVRTYGKVSKTGQALRWLLLWLLVWWGGEVLWTYYDLMGIFPGYTWADVFYLSGYPLALIGFGKLMKLMQVPIWQGLNRRQFWLEILALAALMGLVWYWSVYVSFDAGRPLLENLILVLYGLSDSVLVVIAFLMLRLVRSVSGGSQALMWKYLLAGMVLFFLGDLFYVTFYDQYAESLLPYKYIEVLWVLSYAALVVGIGEGLRTVGMVKGKITTA